MKKVIVLIVALMFAFAVASVGFAADKSMDAPKADVKMEKKAEPAKDTAAPADKHTKHSKHAKHSKKAKKAKKADEKPAENPAKY